MVDIACVLTPEQAATFDERLAGYRALGRDGLVSVSREPRRVTLRFRGDPEIRRGVHRLVAAESECCAFLGYEVDEQRDTIVLTLTAPHGGEEIMHDLADLLAPG
jgi:hypothetical protein